MMTRRQLLFAGSGALLQAQGRSQPELGVEAYIFQQYASRQHKKLREVLPETISMVRQSGFRNIELNSEFLEPELKDDTLRLIRENRLRMPSVYNGGTMHLPQVALQTIEKTLSIGKICRPFGCRAVVFNANPKGKDLEKTDAELEVQAASLNQLGQILSRNGFQLRVHNHTPEMRNGAREWRNMLRHTDPKYVSFCLDLDWVWQGGQDPFALLREAGERVTEIHVRSARDKLWLESFQTGDIDYRRVADYFRSVHKWPYIVVELAYRDETIVSRPLGEDLRLSHFYAQKVFGLGE